jgi:hypothetical protein
LEVGARGLRRDDELGGDLLIRHAAGEEAEDLDLALGQAGGSVAAFAGAVAGGGEDRVRGVGVDAAGTDVLAQLHGRLL